MSTPTGQAIADALYEPSLAAAFSDYPTLWEKQCRAVLPLLDEVIAERDHARELACRLEQELAHAQASHARGATKKEPDA